MGEYFGKTRALRKMSEKLSFFKPEATFQRYDANCNVFKFLFSWKIDFSHVYSKLPNKIMEKRFMEERSLTPVVSIGSELVESFEETRALRKMS